MNIAIQDLLNNYRSFSKDKEVFIIESSTFSTYAFPDIFEIYVFYRCYELFFTTLTYIQIASESSERAHPVCIC